MQNVVNIFMAFTHSLSNDFLNNIHTVNLKRRDPLTTQISISIDMLN